MAVSDAQQAVIKSMRQAPQAKRLASSNLKLEFDNLLVDSIDQPNAFFFARRRSQKQRIFLSAQHKFNIEKDAIPRKVGQSQLAIEKIFGASATVPGFLFT